VYIADAYVSHTVPEMWPPTFGMIRRFGGRAPGGGGRAEKTYVEGTCFLHVSDVPDQFGIGDRKRHFSMGCT
jgi:hypothetical protein